MRLTATAADTTPAERSNPRSGGAYSQYQVGQYTGFGGVEETQEGSIHFAGEHTSPDFQGFMEGAVTTGERAATEILRAVPRGTR